VMLQRCAAVVLYASTFQQIVTVIVIVIVSATSQDPVPQYLKALPTPRGTEQRYVTRGQPSYTPQLRYQNRWPWEDRTRGTGPAHRQRGFEWRLMGPVRRVPN